MTSNSSLLCPWPVGDSPVGGLASWGMVLERPRGDGARGDLERPRLLRGDDPRTDPRPGVDDDREEPGAYTTGGDRRRGVLHTGKRGGQ